MGIEYYFKYDGCTCEGGFATEIAHCVQVDVLLSTCILIIYLIVTRSRPGSTLGTSCASYRQLSATKAVDCCADDKLDCAALGSIFAHP